jgi:hypothetical protein
MKCQFFKYQLCQCSCTTDYPSSSLVSMPHANVFFTAWLTLETVPSHPPCQDSNSWYPLLMLFQITKFSLFLAIVASCSHQDEFLKGCQAAPRHHPLVLPFSQSRIFAQIYTTFYLTVDEECNLYRER